MRIPDEYKHLSVLIVDDVFNVRNMIRTMLKQLGFSDFVEANDGYAAVEKLATNTVDVVLCDWNMPKMKGIDVLKFVRGHKELHHMPFVMITGEMTEEIVAEAAETEVDAYLVKPFTMEQLGSKILQLLTSRKELTGIDAHLQRGRAYVTTKQFDKAKQEFEEALQLNPRSPRTMLEIGRLYEEQGNDSQAKEYYHRAVEVSPQFLRGYEALAKLYQALGDTESHLKYLDKAVSISPRNLERRLMLGETLIKTGNKDEAKKVLARVLEEAAEQYAEIAQRVGQSLLAIEAYDVAEEAFSRALDSDPQNLHLFNDLGIAFRKQGKFKEAVANYLRALKIAPKDENLLYNLARAHHEGGDKAMALKTVQKALKINPNFKEAKQLVKIIGQES